MATFSQEAKRLVLVSNGDYDPTAFNIVDANTNVGFINANGAEIADMSSIPAAVNAVMIGLGASSTSFLKSEAIQRGTAKATFKAYEAPYEAVSLLRYGAGTYDAGEELVISIRFDGYGSLSMKNTYAKHGVYLVAADATTSATAVAALVTSLNKNLDKDGVPRATASIGSNSTTDIATSLATLIGTGTNTVDLTNGSRNIVLGDGASANDDADANDAGWVILPDGNVYYLTLTAASHVAGVGAYLDRPYAGATAADVAVATAFTELTTADLLIVGDPQSEINFEHMMNKASFSVEALKDREADTNVTLTSLGSSIGVGYGPHVANIETFANQSLNRDQFTGPDYRRYNAPLNTVTSTNYDVVNIKVSTTKRGSGSNVTSIREIDVFVPTGGAAAEIASDLNAFV